MPEPLPPPRASARFVAIYALAYAALWLALLTPAMITLALRVRQLAGSEAERPASLVLFVGAIAALVGNPIFGALSDRTRSRFGRRRPYLVGGVLAGFAALALMGQAPSITLVGVGWCLAQLAYNAVLAALVAIVPDRIPASQRGTVVGILGVCMPVGQIVGTWLVQLFADNLTLALLVPGAIGVAGVLALTFVLPDTLPAQAALESQGAPGRSRHFDLLAHRDFLWAWSSRVLFVMGSIFLQVYQPFLLLDGLGFRAVEVPRLIFRSTLVQAAMVVMWSLIAGRLSDRTGRRKPIAMVGSVIQGLGLWLIAIAPTYTTFLFGIALTGMGHGVYEGVNLALVTEVLPDRARHAAKDLGLLNITNTLPQVVAPLAAPAILAMSGGDYMLLFLVAGAIPLMGTALLSPVRSVR
jgi:MFS family permease